MIQAVGLRSPCCGLVLCCVLAPVVSGAAEHSTSPSPESRRERWFASVFQGIRAWYSEHQGLPLDEALQRSEGSWAPGRYFQVYAVRDESPGWEPFRNLMYEPPRQLKARLLTAASSVGAVRGSIHRVRLFRGSFQYFQVRLRSQSLLERKALVRFEYTCGGRSDPDFTTDFTLVIPPLDRGRVNVGDDGPAFVRAGGLFQPPAGTPTGILGCESVATGDWQRLGAGRRASQFPSVAPPYTMSGHWNRSSPAHSLVIQPNPSHTTFGHRRDIDSSSPVNARTAQRPAGALPGEHVV